MVVKILMGPTWDRQHFCM